MNFISMFLEDGATPTASGSTAAANNNSWLIFVILGALLVLMLVMNIFTRKKGEKAANEMQSMVKVGAKVKTIGGFVGTIERIDEAKGLLTLNIGTEDCPTYVVIDRVGIYQIENPETASNAESDKDDVYGYDNKDTGDTSSEYSESQESGSEEASSSEETQDNE